MIYYKYFLFTISTLISGMAMAQSVNNSDIPFKEIQRKKFTDNFTGRDIKKKELEITPSQIVFLNTAGTRPTKDEKNRKNKK